MILTDEEIQTTYMTADSGELFARAIEAAVLSKLAAGVSVEPAYKAKPHSNLPTVVVSAQVDYYTRDQITTAIAAARVQAINECADKCDELGDEHTWHISAAIRALINKPFTTGETK